MGHTRLGRLPKSKKWSAVLSLLGGGSSLGTGDSRQAVAEIAALTLDAAKAGLDHAVEDIGLRYTFFLLTQVVLAARCQDWQERLANTGVTLDSDSTVFDLVAEVQCNIDDYVSRNGRHTDVSEMAQQAAGEALASLVGPQATTLFGSGTEDLRNAIHHLSTKNGFSRLGHVFFSRFTERFLNFYISRATASQTGGPALQEIRDVSAFNASLHMHCEQTARIVHDFCGQWYSKTQYLEGIDLKNTSRFMAVALKKLRNELSQQRAEL